MIFAITAFVIMLLHDVVPLVRKRDVRGLCIYLPCFALILIGSILFMRQPIARSPFIWFDRMFREVLNLGYQ